MLFLSACTDAQLAAETVTPAGSPAAFLATIAGTPQLQLNRVLCAIRARLRGDGYTQHPQVSCGRAAP